MFEQEVDENGEKKSMQVCGNCKTNSDAYKSPKFDTIIRRDTTQHIIGDDLIFSNNKAAEGSNNEADKHPTDTKIPLHGQSIT